MPAKGARSGDDYDNNTVTEAPRIRVHDVLGTWHLLSPKPSADGGP